MSEEIKPFPECSDDCNCVKEFGVCECESFCSEKFNKDGSPKKKEEINECG